MGVQKLNWVSNLKFLIRSRVIYIFCQDYPSPKHSEDEAIPQLVQNPLYFPCITVHITHHLIFYGIGWRGGTNYSSVASRATRRIRCSSSTSLNTACWTIASLCSNAVSGMIHNSLICIHIIDGLNQSIA